DVAHTRPVPVVGSAQTEEDAERLCLQSSRYEGPTGIVGVLHDISNRSQLPSVSFWAAAPHYLPAGVNPKATLALVQRICTFRGTDVDVTELLPSVEAWERRISELVAENDTRTQDVQRLGEAGDDQGQ